MTTCRRCGHDEAEHRWLAIYRRFCVRVLTADYPTRPCGCARYVR